MMINKYFLAKMNIPAYLKKFLYNRYYGYIIEGVPPITFKGNGKNLIDYRIYGASGGVGDRTKNLFNYNTVTEGYRIQWETGNLYQDESAIMSDYIPVEENSIYNCNIDVYFLGYDTNFNYLGTWNRTTFVKSTGLATKQLTITEGCSYIKFFTYNTNKTPVSISNLTMLNEGSTELPYEPYGYKVPVVINGKNLLNTKLSIIQLGAGITFQKNNDGTVVLNGTPSGNFSLIAFPVYLTAGRYVLSGCPESQDSTKLRCDLRDSQYATVGGFDIGNGVIISVNSPGNYFFGIRVGNGYNCNNLKFYPMIRLTTIEDDTYETYHEPTTTNIYLDEPIEENESISLSDTNTNIPTIKGTNILTVDTTVQPSNVYIKVGGE